jgi:uncharacterized membrane protein YdfJ with MMPL/SSD domain
VARLGRLIFRRHWLIYVLLWLLMFAAAAWGVGVLAAFKTGGFEDPHASSTFVSKITTTYFPGTSPDITVVYRSDTMTVDDPRFMADVVTTVARLPRSEVAQVTSYWNDTASLGALVSRDRHATLVTLKMVGDDVAKAKNWTDLKPRLTAPGLQTGAGGAVPMGSEFGTQMVTDIKNAEMISLPVVLILGIAIFGSGVSAILPISVGIFSIFTGLATLRTITLFTGVTNTALEIVTMVSVGLAIDYSLFIITRFREELDAGRDRQTALVNTMATAGRTIVFSGITVTTALSGLLLFPQMFLRSIGLAGMATVMVAVFGAVVLLPTMLAILGHRVDWLRMPWRRRKAVEKPAERQFWYRLGSLVMRRPLPFFAGVLILLGVMAGPFLHVHFGTADPRQLPKASPTRQVWEDIKHNFATTNTEPIEVIVYGDLIPKNWKPSKKSDNIPTYLQDYRKKLGKLPHVTDSEFSGYSGDYGAVQILVTHNLDPLSQDAATLVEDIRATPVPSQNGIPLHTAVGGSTAAQLDLLNSLKRILPWMALIVGTVTFILLFSAFGSILLPLKAIVMNVLSISASFGVIVWGFQDGHLAKLLNFTPAPTDPSTMVFILCMVFGLSMDYEVFLLSRIREEWDNTHDNRLAVIVGMQKTGGIITSAALLFLVVITAFATAGLTFIKLIGVGMFVAITVDALLVRSLLVPATMRFLGAANWWLPGPLAGLHRRIDLRETSGPAGAVPARPARRPRPAGTAPAPNGHALPGPGVFGSRREPIPEPFRAETVPALTWSDPRQPSAEEAVFQWSTPPGGGPAARVARIRHPKGGSVGALSFLTPPAETVTNSGPAPAPSTPPAEGAEGAEGVEGVEKPTRRIVPSPNGYGWRWSDEP